MFAEATFTQLEESVSFYTRNDYAVINSLLVNDYEKLWKDALLAYEDNRGVVEEYSSGVRKINSQYDLQ